MKILSNILNFILKNQKDLFFKKFSNLLDTFF